MDTKERDAATKTRISQIGGRYLLFDIDDIVHIRREHSICAVLVGNTPQAPNQTVFSGLPLELKPDEALFLVEKGVAFIEDDCAAHLSRLRDLQSRRAYAEGLRKQRRAVQAMLNEEVEEKRRTSERIKVEKMKGKAGKKKAKEGQEMAKVGTTLEDKNTDAEVSLFENPAPASSSPMPTPSKSLTSSTFFTPTTSALLIAHPSPSPVPHELPARPRTGPLQAHLNSRGYYLTPGLRFGGHFSAYPGDPFRYHAHYMASSYGWDEQIPMLNLVGTGRLATGVKKGYVFGAEAPGGEDEGTGEKDVRAFTLEWAGI